MITAPIRPIESADVPRLVSVSRAADTMFAEAGLDLPPDDPRETLAQAASVLVAGDPLCGLAALTALDGGAHLEQLAVHPDHGRQGIGSALLEAACACAREWGSAAMTLTTFRDLPWNGPWYARRGFVEHPARLWGADLAAQWRAEADIQIAPRVAMVRRLDNA
ncbi:GNAT family N-acetyltransferase [Nocardiopsis rhodophaea]|uniref:GNAT family N-acetyltransferase n=1 Tax=Nocardiopsis rhodophaea TaxID=280238 RepID=UPI0031D3EAAB